MNADQVAEKVKKFFKRNSINRHKITVLTPGLHASISDCDDKRFDMRPFLYNISWEYQFKQIDDLVKACKKN